MAEFPQGGGPLHSRTWDIDRSEDVDVGFLGLLTHPAYDFQPVQPRHAPIEDRHSGAIITLKNIPGLLAIIDGDNLITPIAQHFPEMVKGANVIVRDQYLIVADGHIDLP